ncbi:hypothetical protein BV22DRAFT_1198513 [Leucogyrophana mollusca]|uniref:Uncharacterized protein n=1 Tax=Leucogyrophana mollusca TaxID=85980 RepID=A0ACB8B7Z3_9AGAM|nr:hypothetical protein BV22DRAFT_1198513 [Leucogyrophana mollusca]
MSTFNNLRSSPEPTSPLDAWPKTPTFPPGLPFAHIELDACSDSHSSGTDSGDEEHTITAFGDISLTDEYDTPTDGYSHQVEILRPLHTKPRLRLKVKRPPFPKKRTNIQRTSGDWSPKSPCGIFDRPWSSPPVSPLSPKADFAAFVETLKSPYRHVGATKPTVPSKQQEDSPYSEDVPPRNQDLSCATDTPADPSLHKATDAPATEVINGLHPKITATPPPKPTEKSFRRLPPRLPIPKWDQ